MNNLKFRVWHKKDKEYQKLLEIDFESGLMKTKIKGSYILSHVEYKNIVLEQYTGLKDKNGKEIYEGDIVYLPKHNHYGKVYFNVEHGYVVSGICMSVKVHLYKDIEVVGNIHENGGLL